MEFSDEMSEVGGRQCEEWMQGGREGQRPRRCGRERGGAVEGGGASDSTKRAGGDGKAVEVVHVVVVVEVVGS